jgi:putative endonuclease
MPSPHLVARSVRKTIHAILWKVSPPRHQPLNDDLKLGLAGENAAARFLRTHGYKILLRRFQSPFGEIDLVCRDGETLVFVEVKSRERDDAVRPSDAIGSAKQLHISRSALDYLRRLDNPEIPVRFDVVEVLWVAPRPKFTLIQDAFPLSEPYRY